MAALLEQQPFTEELLDENGNRLQLEIQLTWDDKKEGIIRVSAFVDGGSDKWWNSFFTKSQYERFVRKNK